MVIIVRIVSRGELATMKSRILALLLGVSLIAPAQAMELYAWQPEPASPAIVIAARDEESPEAAALRYLSAVKTDPKLTSLLSSDPLPDLPLRGFTKLNDQDEVRSKRVLLLANRPSDYAPGHWRVRSFSESVIEQGQAPYLAPIAFDSGLTSKEAREFAKRLDQTFPHFIAMGGADVDPTLFGDANTHSIDVNSRRDRAEATLLSTKLRSIRERKADNRITAICRGAQLSARLLGYRIGQDIKSDLESPLSHGSLPTGLAQGTEPNHPIRILPTTSNLLSRAFSGRSEAIVNTYHHQHIIWHTGGPLELAAVSPDGITEAMESPDGRIRLFQFHPELMRIRSRGPLQTVGARLMREVIAPPPPRCQALFRTSVLSGSIVTRVTR